MVSIEVSRRALFAALAGVAAWSSMGVARKAGGSAEAQTRAVPRPSTASPLFAALPSTELGDAAALYDGLIGSWDVEAIDHAADGSKRSTPGEWHFAWVLEGRAVQDVLIVPRRADRAATGQSRQGNRYGTTVRFYDPVQKTWRIVWVNPVNGSLNTLVAHKDGDRIVHEGAGEQGVRLRWTFVTVTRERFHWLGEFSIDNGVTWRPQAEFLGQRTSFAPMR